MWQIIRLGLPLGGAALLRNGARLVYLGIVGARLGTQLQAAVAIGMQVRLVVVLTALAFQVGLNTLVGQALGRRNVREAQILSRQGIALLSILMFGITLLLFLFSNPLASWLLESPAAAVHAGSVLRWFALAQFFSAVSIGMQGILMGRGDTGPVMRYTVITQWLVLVPLALAGSYLEWTPQGVLLAWVVGPLVMLWLLQRRVRRGVWITDTA